MLFIFCFLFFVLPVSGEPRCLSTEKGTSLRRFPFIPENCRTGRRSADQLFFIAFSWAFSASKVSSLITCSMRQASSTAASSETPSLMNSLLSI